MAASRGTKARRVCLVAAGVCLLFALAPSSPAQEQDTVPRPEVWRGNASSQVVSVQVDRDAFLPVPELFRFIALDGAGIYGSSNQQARASLFFPGNGFILGPSLVCGTFGGQFPAEFKPILDTCLQYKYPLTVFADGFEPDGNSAGSLVLASPSDPISGHAVRAAAHAGEDASTTDAVMQDLRVLGVPPFGPITPQIAGFEMDTSLINVDSATSRTNQRISKGSLIIDAEATLSGVNMIGGLIHIDSLRSLSHVTDDAHGKRTATPTLVMSGVTVGGVPAQFTKDGLVLGSSGSGPLDQQLESAANRVLQALDIKATVLDSTQSLDQNGAAAASVGGVLIEFSRDVQGLPQIPGPVGQLDPNGLYKGSIQLGNTGALGAAFTFGSDGVDTDQSGVTDFPYFNDANPDLPGVYDPGSPGVPGDFSSPASDAGVAAPVAGDRGPAVASGGLVRSIGGFFGDRLGMLYLALMFAVLGLCIAPRLTPARLP